MKKKKFLKEARREHGKKYIYERVEIKKKSDFVDIICPKHGSFNIKPADHIAGKGCPDCSESKGERRVRCYLESKDLHYIQEHTFDDLKDKGLLRFDFYVPKKNLVIEYHGKQHYEPVELFGGQQGLLETQRRDKIKKEYAQSNGILFIEIPYTVEDVRLFLMNYL